MMKRSGWLTIVACSCVSLLSAACSSGSGNGNPDAAKPGEAVNQEEAAELTFYGNSTQSQQYFNTYYGDAIRKKFPNYTIHYLQLDAAVKATTLPELVATKTTIDIYYATIGNFESALQTYDLQVDMTDLIKKHGIDTNRFEPTLIDAMKINTGGLLYGIPIQSNVQALYYNKDLFDKFGVPYPKDGMTWDEAAEISGKLTRFADGKQYYGFSATFGHTIRSNQFSLARADPKTETPTIAADPKWKTFYETIFGKMMPGEAYKQRFLQNSTLDGINGFIKDQEVGMLNFFAQLYLTNPEELKAMNWDLVSMPTFRELPGIGSQSYPMYFGVTKLAKNPDAAAKVLKYMASEEFQVSLARKGWMSSLNTEKVRKEYGQDTPFKEKNFAALFINKPAVIPAAPIYDPALVSQYQAAAQSLIKGTTDINTVFRNAEEAGSKAIKAAQQAK
ncbi:ABC transporter substrate-binding protein [Paenibacillus hodogayensis]|uniref:ABC transporter substrate-binding protein n=1 Tax=Paenibacillus hodogayensis TaxID=279208 RepID=A0ABV5VT42_9BACL